MITDLFPATLHTQLDKLSRFFVWRRRPLHDSIVEALQSADARHDAITQAHLHTVARLEALIQTHAQLTELQASTAAELDSTRQALFGAKHSLEQSQIKQQQDQEQAKLRFDALSTQHTLLVQERDQLESTRSALEQILELTRVELLASTEANESLQQSLAQHQQTHAELADNFQALQQRHGDTWTRFELISRLLAARPQDSAGLTRFRELLATDYMAFAESESSLAAEAKALTLLQSIEQELALLVSFPDIRERTIVSIVGGFSSGKSEFINSFIDDQQVRLAVGLKPVTAIPSYVLATDKRTIRGYSANGGHIELDVDFYKNVSHAFISSFSFDLKNLMPFMCVGVQMKSESFSDICFIDTPGYNPPSTAAEHSQGDRRTAVQFSQQADSIIWLIGLDSNGTVPDSDLEFIQQIGVEGRSVYVVLTKADLKAEEDIDDILEEVQDRLDDEGIQIEGISAYSSTLHEEVAYRKEPLLEHFARINRPGNARKSIERRLSEVFAMYDEAIQADIAALQAHKTAINGLRLDCLEFGGQEVYERMRESIDKLTHCMSTSLLEEEVVRDSMVARFANWAWGGGTETRTHANTSQPEAWLKESRRLHEAFSEAIQQTAAAVETS
ncbi:dynamin family protein [Stutzerimonas nitrititolerans]|uniref:dynamin family protein n=1 Tax=Stutzerimonas nitrititolerans TaxID=2482751 RepID=UPI0028A2744E|nr:dynamin family protein [Stutzerimonas nitrititolerans]